VDGVLDPCDERAEARAALRDWLALQAALALRPGLATALLRRRPDPRAALALARAAPPPARELDRALLALRRAGARAVPFGSPLYPWRLSRLADAAPLLLVRGAPEVLAGPALAVVGSRAATLYGLSAARTFARELARAGFTIVSGLAFGIDAAAHRGALEAGGRTLAVQACGPDRVYPAAHRALADEIARCGAVVTELPPGAPALRPHFPLRNRLISGLSCGVLVIEGRERSGSLITARHALDQGIDVFALPGPITAPTSAGPNRLIFDGAHPALDPACILEVLGQRCATPAERAARAELAPGAEPPGALVRRSAAQTRILQALGRAPATRDELGRAIGLAPHELALDLLELELASEVAEDRDGRLRIVSAGSL
jgi:DNA processing protein